MNAWIQKIRRAPRAGLFAATVAMATCVASGQSEAATYRGLQIEVVGSGRPLLMIPGLNSAGGVWTETCAALQPTVQCHIVQLPGFAGTAAVAQERYLETMRDHLLAYLDDRKLDQPAVIGHSLGGVLALMMAAEAPARLDRLVIVDSLPFLAGIRNPNASADGVRAMAAGMREQMLKSPAAQWEAQTRAAAQGMSRDAASRERVVAWGLASDRNVTAQAMSELWALDLRPLLPRIERPVLVLGSWAAYQSMGATMASTRQIFETQYAGLKGVQIRMSEAGYHFLMWDDPAPVRGETKAFLRP